MEVLFGIFISLIGVGLLVGILIIAGLDIEEFDEIEDNQENNNK